MKYADIIIPNGVNNGMAIDFISQNLRIMLKKLGYITHDEGLFDFNIIDVHKSIA